MTLGEKIHDKRISLGLTQKELAGEHMTPSMLSEIEHGRATPSLQTLSYLADRLGVTHGYLLDNTYNEEVQQYTALMPQLWDAYRNAEYLTCLELGSAFPSPPTPDLAYLLCCAALSAAESDVVAGSVSLAKEHLEIMNTYLPHVLYDTAHLMCRRILCLAAIEDPITPQYTLQADVYEAFALKATASEEYHYLKEDISYPYENQFYRLHMAAKKLIGENQKAEAVHLLCQITENRFSTTPSLLLLYRVYTDLERCYRDSGDYEKAYRCASKKNTLLASIHT